MKKRVLVLLMILLLCASLSLAGIGMKTLGFGPHKYMISELAPDFNHWNISPAGRVGITPEPTPCQLWLFEGINPNQTVFVRILVVKEGEAIYIAGVAVMYAPDGKRDSYVECYEDLQYFGGGKPSFILTKVNSPGDVEKLIQIKKRQHTKRIAI